MIYLTWEAVQKEPAGFSTEHEYERRGPYARKKSYFGH